MARGKFTKLMFRKVQLPFKITRKKRKIKR